MNRLWGWGKKDITLKTSASLSTEPKSSITNYNQADDIQKRKDSRKKIVNELGIWNIRDPYSYSILIFFFYFYSLNLFRGLFNSEINKEFFGISNSLWRELVFALDNTSIVRI